MRSRSAILATIGLVSACVLALGSGAWGVVSINFDDLADGTILTNQYAASGVAFSYLGSPLEVPGPLVGGKVLMMEYLLLPDDWCYDIQLDFSTPIDWFCIDMLDADENATVSAYYQGQLVCSTYYPAGADRQTYNVVFGGIGSADRYDQIVFDITQGPGSTSGGPEYLDNLSFNSVPEPTSLVALALGMAGLLAKVRRR